MPESFDDIRIVVLPHGFVHVGRWEQIGDEVILSNAMNIRVWGTDGVGLGGLASHGPYPKTILDPIGGLVRVHRLNVIFSVDCDPGTWRNIIVKTE